jgi:hypothetical protein
MDDLMQEETRFDRRRFLLGTAGAVAGAGLASTLGGAGVALAGGNDPGHMKLLPLPEPIPGGLRSVRHLLTTSSTPFSPDRPTSSSRSANSS